MRACELDKVLPVKETHPALMEAPRCHMHAYELEKATLPTKIG